MEKYVNQLVELCCPKCGAKMTLSIDDYEDLQGHWVCPTLGCGKE